MAPPINNFGTMKVTDKLHASALYSREEKKEEAASAPVTCVRICSKQKSLALT